MFVLTVGTRHQK